MATRLSVDVDELRDEVQNKHAEVAEDPSGEFHFHTGRRLEEMVGYLGPCRDGASPAPCSRARSNTLIPVAMSSGG